jgi:1,2-beta-oligoglucan phosphorylase
MNLLIRHALGIRRHFGERIVQPVLPRSLGHVKLEMVVDGRRHGWDLGAT